MKFLKTSILIIVFSMILTACSSNRIDKENDEETQKELETKEEKQIIKIESKQLVKEDGKGAVLDISYPVVSGMEDKDEEKSINEKLYNLAKNAEKQTREFESILQEYNKEYKDIVGTEEHAFCNLKVKEYTITDRYISIDLYEYISEGGSGNEYHIPFVYDLVDKKELRFTDLFEGEIPESELIALLNKQLSSGKYADAVLETITDLPTDQQFYLSDHAVVFFFSKYEYTIGAAGAPEVVITKSSIPNLKEVYR